MANQQLHVLLFKEESLWVAQCLEKDIVGQGATIAEATEALAKTFVSHVILAFEHHEEPLATLKAAPARYWTQWRKASRLADTLPIGVPGDILPEGQIPPAWMLNQVAELRVS